jgi:DNA-binding CsgD family transcriptional regulator
MRSVYLLPWIFLFALKIALAPSLLEAQSAYTVRPFFTHQKGWGNQNWAIDAMPGRVLYVANNKGLLELRPEGERLYQHPEGGNIRSVFVHNQRIYTGSFEELGYWESTEEGNTLNYVSLKPLLEQQELRNDEFWRIAATGNSVYFQSFGSIYRLYKNKLSRLALPGSVLLMQQANQRLFVQQIDGPLYEIKEDELIPLAGTRPLSDKEIKAIVELEENSLLIGTVSNGLYQLKANGQLTRWSNEANQALAENKLNVGIRVQPNLLAFGTIQNGIYLLDDRGQLKGHLDVSHGLSNNTILSLYATPEGNLWAGLDKGLDFIWLKSPVQLYLNKDYEIGSVYDAVAHNNDLYVGTNQGVFFFENGLNEVPDQPQFIKGTEGQCWFLKVIDERVYAGLNHGTFEITKQGIRQIGFFNGGFNLQSFSNQPEVYWQSTYGPIFQYQKDTNNRLKQTKEWGGLSGPFRFLQMDHTGNLLLGHLQKDLYVARPDAKSGELNIVDTLAFEGVNEPFNRIFEMNNRLLVPSSKGWLQWDPLLNALISYEELNEQLGEFSYANGILAAGPQRYWFILEQQMALFEVSYNKVTKLHTFLPEMFGLRLVEGFEQIKPLNTHKFLICGESGFGILDLMHIPDSSESNDALQVYRIDFSSSEGDVKSFTWPLPNDLVLSERFNTVTIHYKTTTMPGEASMFRSQLVGLEEASTPWQPTQSRQFTRLPIQSYTFSLQHLGSSAEVQQTEINFTIKPHWYNDWPGIILAFLLISVIIIAFNIRWKKQLIKNREMQMAKERARLLAEKEQAQTQLFEMTKDRLRSEIDAKTQELAKNVMLVSRKNQALVGLKGELIQLKEDMGYRIPARRMDKIVADIDKNLESDYDWESFELLFDQAHKNFFKRLKESARDLTASELRLCAYLRIGLSSKEIAPLLNISVRGVEEKRYRLRKHLGLKSEDGLTEYLMKF